MWDDNISHSGWGLKKMFESIPFSKLNITEQRTNTIPDDDKVSGKLRSMVDAMIVAAPSLDRQTATHFLLHTAHGRRLAEHLNSISKKKEEEPMPQVNIFKLANIESVREIAKHITEKDDITEFDFTKILMGHVTAKINNRYVNKRDGESDGAAFERILTAPGNGELRQAYQVTKGMASLEPTSVEVGSTLVSDDSAKAVAALREMAEKNGRSFETEFADPANSKLAARTYTQHHRSSVNTDYLEQE
jgi:hypothetical protein